MLGRKARPRKYRKEGGWNCQPGTEEAGDEHAAMLTKGMPHREYRFKKMG